MECMLAAICLYVDLAVGAHKQYDAPAIHQQTGIVLGNAEQVTRPNPLGRVKLGAEWTSDSKRYQLYIEADHYSSMATGFDRGFNGGWIGTRFRF